MMDEDTRKVSQGLSAVLLSLETLKAECKNDQETKAISDQTPDAYRGKLNEVAIAISHQVTKFSFAFSSEPKPDLSTFIDMKDPFLKHILYLYTLKFEVPYQTGKALTNVYSRFIDALIDSIVLFVKSVQESYPDEVSHLPATGAVWQNCKSIENLPKTNYGAVLLHVSQYEGIMVDALNELEEEWSSYKSELHVDKEEGVEGDDDDDDSDSDMEFVYDEKWTPAEAKIVPNTLSLVRCVVKIMRLLKAETLKRNEKNTDLLDKFRDLINSIHKQVDNVVCEVYATQDTLQLLDSINVLIDTVNECVMLSGFREEVSDDICLQMKNLNLRPNLNSNGNSSSIGSSIEESSCSQNEKKMFKLCLSAIKHNKMKILSLMSNNGT